VLLPMVAAVFALMFALPAIASASEWRQSGAPIEGEIEVPYEAAMEYSYIDQAECLFSGTAVFRAGTPAFEIVSAGTEAAGEEGWERIINNQNQLCFGKSGYGGANCVGIALGENLPWSVELPSYEGFKLNGFRLNSNFEDIPEEAGPEHCKLPGWKVFGSLYMSWYTGGEIKEKSWYEFDRSGLKGSGLLREEGGSSEYPNGGNRFKFFFPSDLEFVQ
jgi:hypothetical protein